MVFLRSYINGKKFFKLFALLFIAGTVWGTASFVPKNPEDTRVEPQPEITSKVGIQTIVIDAGHGGKDPGNLGTGRYKSTEKNISLDVALKVGAYIKKAFPKIKVIYTRDDDTFIGLKERTDLANEAEADLFISIHCNSAGNKAAVGTETFVMGLHKQESNLKKLVDKENNVRFLEDDHETKYGNIDPSSPEKRAIFEYIQKTYLEQSIGFATAIQDQYRERVNRVDRKVKQAGLYVISYTAMPSVLTELGFLTNPKEEDFLNTEQGKVYMASAIFRAFKSYKKTIDGANANVTPDETPEEKKEEKKEEKPEEKPEEKKPEEKPEEKKDDKPTTEVKEKPAEVEGAEVPVYKVQISASDKKIELKSSNFKGLKDVSYYKAGKMYKYTVGQETDFKEIVKLQRKVREAGYPQAFVIAIYKGKRITTSEARKITNSN